MIIISSHGIFSFGTGCALAIGEYEDKVTLEAHSYKSITLFTLHNDIENMPKMEVIKKIYHHIILAFKDASYMVRIPTIEELEIIIKKYKERESNLYNYYAPRSSDPPLISKKNISAELINFEIQLWNRFMYSYYSILEEIEEA